MAKAPEPPFDVANIFRAQRLMLGGARSAPASPVAAPVQVRRERRSAVRRLLSIAKKRRQWGLLAVTVVVLSTIVWTTGAGQQFEAKGSLLLAQRTSGSAALLAPGVWQGYFSSVVLARLGRSPVTHKRAAALIRAWVEDDSLRPGNLAEAGAAAKERILALSPTDIGALVKTTADVESSSVDFLARHPDPQVAVYAAQGALSAVYEEIIKYQLSLLDIGELVSQTEAARARLLEVERSIARLRADSLAGHEPPADPSGILEHVRDLDRQVDDAELQRAEVARRIELIRSRLDSPDYVTPPIPAFLLQKLLSRELLLEDYLNRYTDEHPKVKKLRREIDSVRCTIDRIKSEPEQFRAFGSSLEQELRSSLAEEEAGLAGLEQRVESLKARRDALNAAFIDGGGDQTFARLHGLEARRTALTDMLTELQLRTEKMRFLAEQIGRKKTAFTNVEAVPAKWRSLNPPRLSVYLFSAILGLLAAFGVMGLIEVLDPTVHDLEKVEAATGAPPLGAVPFFSRNPFIFPENPNTPSALAFGAVRDRLRFAGPGNPEKLIAVTSSRDGEGKSYAAVNLAISFAQQGDVVVLVDADFRQRAEKAYREALVVPSAADNWGLMQFIQSEETAVDDVTHGTEMENLFVVASGGTVETAVPLLRSPRLGVLVQSLSTMFDVIVLDCPTVLTAAETAQLAGKARSTVLVCSWGETPYRDIEESSRRLRSVRANLAGVIVNKVPQALVKQQGA